MKIGTNTIASLKIGSTDISEVRIGSVLVWSAFTYDADALAYFAANTAITLDADKLEIDAFYKGLKADGIYTKIHSMWLSIFNSAADNKWNLKDPRDLDAAHRLAFSGGWTHSNGMTGNATNTYANTFITPSFTTYDDLHIGVYVGNNTADGYDIGVSDDVSASVNEVALISRYSNGKAYYSVDNGYALNVTQSNSQGFTLGTFNSSLHRLYKNGTEIGNSSATGITMTSAYNLIIGASNNAGSINYFTAKTYRFVTIGGTLSSSEQAAFYSRIQTLLTHFGLNV